MGGHPLRHFTNSIPFLLNDDFAAQSLLWPPMWTTSLRLWACVNAGGATPPAPANTAQSAPAKPAEDDPPDALVTTPLPQGGLPASIVVARAAVPSAWTTFRRCRIKSTSSSVSGMPRQSDRHSQGHGATPPRIRATLQGLAPAHQLPRRPGSQERKGNQSYGRIIFRCVFLRCSRNRGVRTTQCNGLLPLPVVPLLVWRPGERFLPLVAGSDQGDQGR